jgi:hypothetical protein
LSETTDGLVSDSAGNTSGFRADLPSVGFLITFDFDAVSFYCSYYAHRALRLQYRAPSREYSVLKHLLQRLRGATGVAVAVVEGVSFVGKISPWPCSPYSSAPKDYR